MRSAFSRRTPRRWPAESGARAGFGRPERFLLGIRAVPTKEAPAELETPRRSSCAACRSPYERHNGTPFMTIVLRPPGPTPSGSATGRWPGSRARSQADAAATLLRDWTDLVAFLPLSCEALASPAHQPRGRAGVRGGGPAHRRGQAGAGACERALPGVQDRRAGSPDHWRSSAAERR